MGYPDYTAQNMATNMARISEIIDESPANKKMSQLEQLLLRTMVKVAEEKGETSEALIGYTGQNPRKGFTHVLQDVENELLDTALTALGGVEHINGNDGSSVVRLAEHIERIRERLEQATA